MRYGVIPDIHDRVDLVQRIMDKVSGIDKWIHLGDYFDSFPNEGATNRAIETAKKVKEWLRDPNIVNLMGNHDLSYGWSGDNRIHRCSGYTTNKRQAIHQEISWEDWQRFTLHYWVEGPERPWLITHAGFDKDFCWPKRELRWTIDAQCEAALKSLHGPIPYERGEGHTLLSAGRDRGGRNQFKGGILWSDWRSLEPPPGVNQLVGHTIGFQHRVEDWRGCTAVCIDTSNRHYAVLEDGLLSVCEVDKLT